MTTVVVAEKPSVARDIAREEDMDVDEDGFSAAMEAHRIASGGGKAMGELGGEDAELYAWIVGRAEPPPESTEATDLGVDRAIEERVLSDARSDDGTNLLSRDADKEL